MFKKILTIIAFTFLTISSCNDETTSPNELNDWQIFNSQNSPLPSDKSVNHIYYDDSGNIWLGLWGVGILKYDGNSWTNYNASNSGLPDNNISYIKVEQSGKLWVAMYGGGIATFAGGNWAVFNSSNSGLTTDLITTIEFETTSMIKWIGTGVGLYRYDGNNWEFFDLNNSELPNPFVESILVVGFNQVWIGNQGPYISLFNGSVWQVYSNVIDVAWCISKDKNNNIWIGTNSGIVKFDGTNFTTYNTSNSSLPSNSINDIAVDSNNILWIATSKGLTKYDGNNWTVFNSSNSPLKGDADVKSIVIDKNGKKILGLDSENGGGIAIYSGK